MRVLILNWRCPKNPRAGGAEAVTFEIARRLVKQGDSVEWFSATFPGAAEEETIDGIHFVRAGLQWTVHWAAYRHYRRNIANRFDIVVDEVNTIPFFTPLWSDVPSVMFIHQLAREVWWYEADFPLNVLGFALEPLYLRPYRSVPVITVSASTKDDLERLGFKGPITVVPQGLESITDVESVKTTPSQFLYVGRLAPSKRIEHMVHALATFRRATGHGTLWLAGSGSPGYEHSIRRLAQRLGLAEHVAILGPVSSAEKHRLMAAACALLMTSVREGWGLVITEANACGTPAIVYDVPGLRDSVRNELTGLVVRGSPSALSAAMVRVSGDSNLRARLAASGLSWSQGFTFHETARAVGSVLETTIATRGVATPSVVAGEPRK